MAKLTLHLIGLSIGEDNRGMNWGDHHLRSIWNGFSFRPAPAKQMHCPARSMFEIIGCVLQAWFDRFVESRTRSTQAFLRWSQRVPSMLATFLKPLVPKHRLSIHESWSRASWFKSVYLANLFNLGAAFSNDRSALTSRGRLSGA